MGFPSPPTRRCGRCFLEQPFVKDGDVKVSALLEAKGKELGDTLSVTRFARFGLGE